MKTLKRMLEKKYRDAKVFDFDRNYLCVWRAHSFIRVFCSARRLSFGSICAKLNKLERNKKSGEIK